MDINKAAEIFNMYYEINYLRQVIMLIVNNLPEAEKYINEDTLKVCKEKAHEDVMKQMPFLLTPKELPQVDENLRTP